MTDVFLVGDIGGTNSRLALGSGDADGLELSTVHRFANEDFYSLSELVTQYLDGIDNQPLQALFGMAGPVERDGSVQLVNRDWPKVIPKELESELGLQQVQLVNDFAAMARSVPALPDTAFKSLRDGEADPDAPIIVMGPGTGLGTTTLLQGRDKRWMTVGSETGHAAYRASNDLERAIETRLAAAHGYVHYEMIVAGAWLQNLLDIVSDELGQPRRDLTPGNIISHGRDGDLVCEAVCAMRCNAVMGLAGDLVLMNGALGGVVLAGDVAKLLLPWLTSSDALSRFGQRGRYTDYLAPVPIHLLDFKDASLVGAATILLDGA